PRGDADVAPPAQAGGRRSPAVLDHSAGGFAPLPIPPPRIDCAGKAGARTALTPTRFECRSKLRARRGPREEPTGAYAVVREDRRRPRTKSGEVRWTGTRSELQHDDPGDGDAGAEQRGARQALAEEDPREGDREHRRRGRDPRREAHAGVLDGRDEPHRAHRGQDAPRG